MHFPVVAGIYYWYPLAGGACSPAGAGHRARSVPACLVCHGAPRRNSAFPILEGQPAPYLAGQLHLFRDGQRGAVPTPI
jgi:cytochrome c553